jgi:stringent starvation protein B
VAIVINSTESTSTRPYLIRALHEWCIDNGFTPLITVQVDANTQVPKEHVKDKEIVLNLSFDATSGLKLGNDYIEFKARFSGVARDILVPVNRVVAIYARENSQGMAFPTIAALDNTSSTEMNAKLKEDQSVKQAATPTTPVTARPSLKIVK